LKIKKVENKKIIILRQVEIEETIIRKIILKNI
jgi:hypothetical protein